MAEMKQVVWTIENAHIVPGVKDAKGDQPIFKITGTIRRSDSKNPAKGEAFLWTENKRNAGFKIDVSGFDKETGTGTITVSGTVGKNGRKSATPLVGKSLAGFADLHFADSTPEPETSK